ncbi:hypothetical protein ACA910_005501 [Epithemia clementina (nom. ined.)]
MFKICKFSRQEQLMIALGSSVKMIYHGGCSLSLRPMLTNKVTQERAGSSSTLQLLTNKARNENNTVVALNPMWPFGDGTIDANPKKVVPSALEKFTSDFVELVNWLLDVAESLGTINQ